MSNTTNTTNTTNATYPNLVTVDYMADYHKYKPSLFRESPNLDMLFESIFSVCDAQQQELLWLSQNMLNIDVAVGYHLDFIGGLVGQPRFLSDFNTEPYFGFDRSYQSETFGSKLDSTAGGRWNSRSYFNTATARKLSDDEYRRIIKARVISNNSNCCANDLLEVINLITNATDSTVQLLSHGVLNIKTTDTTGVLAYFVNRYQNIDSILPIAAGVRVYLESI